MGSHTPHIRACVPKSTHKKKQAVKRLRIAYNIVCATVDASRKIIITFLTNFYIMWSFLWKCHWSCDVEKSKKKGFLKCRTYSKIHCTVNGWSRNMTKFCSSFSVVLLLSINWNVKECRSHSTFSVYFNKPVSNLELFWDSTGFWWVFYPYCMLLFCVLQGWVPD